MTKDSNFRAFVLSGMVAASAVCVFSQSAPRVFLLDGNTLQQRKAETGDPAVRSAIALINADARRSMSTIIPPVTAKDASPPSGDRHDYMSQAPYFWRNPKTADGMPYV